MTSVKRCMLVERLSKSKCVSCCHTLRQDWLFNFIAVYIDSLVMISIEWSEKTQKNALDVRENYDVIIIRSMT